MITRIKAEDVTAGDVLHLPSQAMTVIVRQVYPPTPTTPTEVGFLCEPYHQHDREHHWPFITAHQVDDRVVLTGQVDVGVTGFAQIEHGEENNYVVLSCNACNFVDRTMVPTFVRGEISKPLATHLHTSLREHSKQVHGAMAVHLTTLRPKEIA